MRRKLLLLALTLLLSGCNIPLEPHNDAISANPSPEPVTTTMQSTADINNDRPCGFQWATQTLPELSIEVEQALKDAGLPNARARADAYGENCIDENGEIVYFATMETDFHITLKAKDLADLTELGQLLDTTLTALDNFPTDETPGLQPGYIGITFEARGEELRLWVMLSRVDQLRQEGLTGTELLQALRNP